MGRPKGWASDQTGRPVMRSPGRPPVGRREHRQRFWAAIARGERSERRGVEAGVSPAVGVRWFREGGGMPTVTSGSAVGAVPVVRRARGDRAAACAVAAGCARSRGSSGARRRRSRGSCGATPRRAAAGLDYRATTAQWHADLRARRPKPAKLAVNERLRELRAGAAVWGACKRPDGSAVAGPEVRVERPASRPAQDRRWGTAWSPEQISAPAAPGLPR